LSKGSQGGAILTGTFTYCEILAKPKETLKEHTYDALRFLRRYRVWQRDEIRRSADILNVTEETLASRLLSMVYLHDIGKSNRDFQTEIRARQHMQDTENGPEQVKQRHGHTGTPHALLSLPFVLAACPPLSIDGVEFRFETLAVMSHHTRFHSTLYSKYRDLDLRNKYLMDEALAFYDELPVAHKRMLRRDSDTHFEEPKEWNTTRLLDEAKRGLDFYPPPEVRDVHSLFVSTLCYCDWLASGKRHGYQYSPRNVRSRVEAGMKEKGFRSWYNYQSVASTIDGNVLIRAPTGKGKTEAGLLWADRNNRGGKIIYLLPTRVTTNSLYGRLRRFFREHTGVSHATAALVLANQENWVKEKYDSLVLLSSHFFMPVTVATVDQLLLSLFNWSHWEEVLESTNNATVIVDEIHAYDTYTTSLILLLVRELAKRGASFAFMSATFPSYLQEALKSVLGKSTLLNDQQFRSMKRHRVRVVSNSMKDLIPDILEHARRGRKVLVVVNTVGSSMEVYQQLKGAASATSAVAPEQLLLYHSRFIERDRRTKECIIESGPERKDGFIVVATQVVEVGLDVDYDVLYSEIAPIDALVQRMGRVNRKAIGPTQVENVILCESGPRDFEVYGKENLSRAARIAGTLDKRLVSEDEVSQLIERQYPRREMGRVLKDELRRVELELDSLRSDLWHVQTLTVGDRSSALYRIASTRKEQFPTIDAIPACFAAEVEKLENPLRKMEYYVRLPLYIFAKCLARDEESRARITADIEYSSELGAVRCSEGEGVV